MLSNKAGVTMGHEALPTGPLIALVAFVSLFYTGLAAADPNFTSVDDVLNGRRLLLRNDDLVIAGQYPPTGGSYLAVGGVLRTRESSIADAERTLELSEGPAEPTGLSLATAHLFDSVSDTMVVAVTTRSEIVVTAPGVSGPHTFSVPADGQYQFVSLSSAVGDVTGDGYDDVYVLSTQNRKFACGNKPYGTHETAFLLTAVDPADPNKGLRLVRIFVGSRCSPDTDRDRAQATMGDFDRDGRYEIAAVVQGELTIAKLNANLTGFDAFKRLTLPLEYPWTDGSSLSLAAGRFSKTAHDQLVVAYGETNGQSTAKLLAYDFDDQMNPILNDTYDTGVKGPFSGEIVVRSGQFAWNSPYDQVALKLGPSPAGQRRLGILRFGPGMKILPSPFLDTSNLPCSFDLAAGNFDRMRANPNPPPPTERDPDLQLAVIWGHDCGAQQFVNIYNVDPPNHYKLTLASTYRIPSALMGGTPIQSLGNRMLLATGDFQGRSLTLGSPGKVTITGHVQPRVVAAMPPMHIDFIKPADGSSATVLNLTGVPAGFFTGYETEQTTTDQSSTTTTTSWAWGAEQKANLKVFFGDPDKTAGFKAELKGAAQQTWEGNVDTEQNTYAAKKFNVARQTRSGGDLLWFNESWQNLYLYPVLRQKVCPAGTVVGGTCPDDKKVPLILMFSGQDHLVNGSIESSSVEWYQPPWEFGNVFSYPGNFEQLRNTVPNLDLKSPGPDKGAQTWYTDGAPLTEKTHWDTKTGGSDSTGSKQNFKEQAELSVQASIAIPGGFIGGGYSLSGSRSDAFGNVVTNKSELGKSTGIAVEKPGFPDPLLYQYAVTPYIFGELPLPGEVQQLPLNTELKTSGVLRTAFVADPLDAHAGAWWSRAYNRPDVGLNHPARWNVETQKSVEPRPPNCLPINSASPSIQCASRALSQPADPWLSPFHYMRGLFITEDGKGSQLSTATAGDELLIQARVFNFSPKAMTPDTTVHVRFYGWNWDHRTDTPVGDSFLIGELETGAIPPFSDEGATPNWLLVGTPFDTTGHAGQYLVFWVVVWMERPDGQIEPELPGHGLTAVPGVLTKLADAPAESYSNNVGFYNSVFYVAPKNQGSQAQRIPRLDPDVQPGPVRVAKRQLARGETIRVETLLQNGKRRAPGLTVYWYDGDPDQRGRLFDIERIPHIRANDRYQVAVPFHSNRCGTHRIYVKVGAGSKFEHIEKSTPVQVACR